MTTNTNQNTQPQAGALSTGALVGVRLAQALGWRVGAGVLLVAGCPLSVAGMNLVSFVDRCVESPRQALSADGLAMVQRAGVYELCSNYSGERFAGWLALGLAVLFLVAAVGLWRRGGAVRDVELLAERVERPQRPPQQPSSASSATVDGVLVK